MFDYYPPEPRIYTFVRVIVTTAGKVSIYVHKQHDVCSFILTILVAKCHLGSLESTLEARSALSYASSNTYASLMFVHPKYDVRMQNMNQFFKIE